MNVKVESLTPVKKRLEIEIPAERVQSELDSAYKTARQKARIKGFRPGKLPDSLLERYFGEEIRRDIRSKLIQESLPGVLDDHDLKMVGHPEIEPSEVKQGHGFRYIVTLEVMPEIELKEYRGLPLQRLEPRVDEEEVEKRLVKMQNDHAQLEPIEDRDVVMRGDVVVVDWEAQGQKREGEVVEVGSEHSRREVEDGLVGVRRGEESVIQVPDPAGEKPTSLHIRVREIKAKRIVPIDNEFAKEYGDSESLEELRSKIRSELQREAEERESQRLREDLITQLIQKNPFEVPEKAVERQRDFLLSTIAPKARTALENTMREAGGNALREELRTQALRQIQRLWLLERIAEKEGIHVNDQEVEREMEELAGKTHRTVPELRRFFNQEGRREEWVSRIREKKTIEFLIGLAEAEGTPAKRYQVDQAEEKS